MGLKNYRQTISGKTTFKRSNAAPSYQKGRVKRAFPSSDAKNASKIVDKCKSFQDFRQIRSRWKTSKTEMADDVLPPSLTLKFNCVGQNCKSPRRDFANFLKIFAKIFSPPFPTSETTSANPLADDVLQQSPTAPPFRQDRSTPPGRVPVNVQADRDRARRSGRSRRCG
jgi:hypothetical protein